MVPTMKIKNVSQAALLKVARAALTAPNGFYKEAGNCKGFLRQICTVAGVPASIRPPWSIDSNQTAQWYRDNHPELCMKNGSLPGDMLFYEKGHGPHGHCVMREEGNIGIENSTRHAPEGEPDGRGVVPLKKLKTPTLIVRVWKNR